LRNEMTRRKIKRRKVKQVNSSSQMSLGLAGQPAMPKSAAANMAVEGNELLFNDPSPDRLFVGSAPLSEFLQEAGFAYIFAVRNLIRQLDLSAIMSGYKPGGRPPYHPASMIGLILHGIMEGRTSLRELETLGRSDVRSWWLTGGVMPSYSIIGRFISKNEAYLTESFFEQLTGEILRKTQSQSSSVAVDGTVIQAAASRYRTIKQEAAEEAAREARRKAKEYSDNTKLARTAEHAERVEKEVRRRDSQREKQGKKKGVSVSPSEPEAVIQPLKTKAIAPSYKGSVAANDDRVITGNAVHPSSETVVVPKLLEQSERSSGERVTEVLEDAGYHCKAILNHAMDNDINLLCPEGQTLNDDDWEKKSEKRFLKNRFIFNEDRDCYVCPAGRELLVDHKYKGNADNPAYVEYRSKSCEGCELKKQCTKAERRAIKRYNEDELREAMREVMTQPGARQRYRKRQAMVEPVFPVLKYQQNLLRFRRKGLSAVSLEFSLQCAAYNIRRYLLLSGILARVRQVAAVWTLIMAIGAIARFCGLLKQQRRTKIPQTIGRCPLCQRGI
jgi:transposase